MSTITAEYHPPAPPPEATVTITMSASDARALMLASLSGEAATEMRFARNEARVRGAGLPVRLHRALAAVLP